MKKSLIAACISCFAAFSWAGRPLVIDDADPVETHHYEVESGVLYERSPGCKHWDYPIGITAGLFPGLEAGVGFGGQLEERTERVEENGTAQCDRIHGIGDLAIGTKWLAVNECPFGARHALALTMKLPTADNDKGLGSGEPDNDVMWIMSHPMGDRAGFHLNVGYSWIGGPDADVLHYGVAVDYQITDFVQWVGDLSAEKKLADGGATASKYITGFRWRILDSLTLDMAAGSKLSGGAPDFMGTAGFTWAFGFDNKTSK